MARISKEDLLGEIRPDMQLTWDFFKRIYSYSVTDPSFPARALDALRAAGCSHAEEYYNTWLQRHNEERDAMMKKVAAWYQDWHPAAKQIDSDRLRERILSMDPEDLTELCQKLLQEGAISDPEELVAFITNQ